MESQKIHPFYRLVGDNISRYRKKKKLTQGGLGLEVGLTRMHINRIENGDNLTLRTLLRLAKAKHYKLVISTERKAIFYAGSSST